MNEREREREFTQTTCMALPPSLPLQLFNTAITRAREWLIIVGDPITLCTVGYNAQCWLELIKKCIETNTFKYPRSELFLNFLETKKVARHVLHQHHQDFISKASTAQVTVLFIECLSLKKKIFTYLYAHLRYMYCIRLMS